MYSKYSVDGECEIEKIKDTIDSVLKVISVDRLEEMAMKDLPSESDQDYWMFKRLI